MNFGATGDAAPNAASSRVARYSCATRTAFSLISSGFQSLLETERCLLASATMRLASTANPLRDHQPLCHAALNDALEHMTQQIALAKAAIPVLRERRVIGNLAIQTESAEPSVRQIEMNLLAEPPLGPDAHAIADKQHPRANNRMLASTGFARVDACPDCPGDGDALLFADNGTVKHTRAMRCRRRHP